MASYQKQLKTNYPMGSISSGTMRNEDLIPAFASELERRLKNGPRVSREAHKAHKTWIERADAWIEAMDLGRDDGPSCADGDTLLDGLFDALGEYAAPYFYFGAHPGDGADYGYWLSEEWDADFTGIDSLTREDMRLREGSTWSVKVNDLAEVPAWFRGEVAVVNDHGNVTLYVKTSRTLREIWAIV